MTNAHTPGPWIVQPAKTGDTLAMIRAALPGYSGTRKIAEVTDVGTAGDANAALIAAAPELLAACKATLAKIISMEIRATWGEAQTLAAAIAKAEGRP